MIMRSYHRDEVPAAEPGTHRADVEPVTGAAEYEPKHAAWRWNA